MQRIEARYRAKRPVGLYVLALVTGVLAIGGCGTPAPPPAPAAVSPLTDQQHARYAAAEAHLRSPEAEVRRQAAVALLSMDYAPAFNAVVGALTNSPDATVRISMIRAAAFCVDHRCFEAVLSNVSHPDAEVSGEAARAVARFTRAEEIDSVVAMIGREDTTAEQRSLLYRALGDALAVRATPVLLSGLESADPQARTAAHEALRRISGRDLPLDLAQWQDWWTANAYRTREDILSEHRQALAREVEFSRERIGRLTEEKQELMRLITAAATETPPTLLAALGNRYESVRLYASVRLAALDAQVIGGLRLDERDYNVIRDALEDASADVRRNVVRFVVALSAPYREDLVRKALGDDDPGVLTAAVLAVRSSTGPEAAARLADLLTKSPHAAVRTEAAIALGKVGSQESVPALLTALDDVEENVRWFCVEGLRKLGAVHAVPRISDLLLRDPSERVRQIAAGALGELGQPAGAVALAQALKDRNEKVRETAAASLLDLATDNADRMSVIADKLRREGMLDRSRQVLRRIIEQFQDVEDAAAQVAGAYRALAEIEQEQGNWPAAADVLEQLDTRMGGDPDVRRRLLACWIRGGQPQRVGPAVEGWLAGADGANRVAVLELALHAAELLLHAGSQREASAILDLVDGARSAAVDRALETKLEELRLRVNGTQAP